MYLEELCKTIFNMVYWGRTPPPHRPWPKGLIRSFEILNSKPEYLDLIAILTLNGNSEIGKCVLDII